jgi:hypothetical protein
MFDPGSILDILSILSALVTLTDEIVTSAATLSSGKAARTDVFAQVALLEQRMASFVPIDLGPDTPKPTPSSAAAAATTDAKYTC